MNVCVIGTGYVGLVTGVCLAEFGMTLICVDNDPEKIATLRQGKVPLFEPGLEDLMSKNVKEKRLRFSTSIPGGSRPGDCVLDGWIQADCGQVDGSRGDLPAIEAVYH
jgi:UDPglucose 6-dehydrogenase